AGGLSVGIAYQGTKPEGQFSFTPGAPGEGGKGGIPGTNDGAKGAGGESYAIP
ncbi:MAG: PE-PGRS family protein, partial [Polyangiaceae bacterium]|nr:PE-PGRS family protein [Polyangiaceae bacterium]